MNIEKRKEYLSLFEIDNLVFITKENMLKINKELLDECIKLGEWNRMWEFVDEEDSIIPFDAGRIQGVIELIFNQKIEEIARNKNGIFIKFKKVI